LRSIVSKVSVFQELRVFDSRCPRIDRQFPWRWTGCIMQA